MLVGTDVYVRMVFVWEETGVPGENPTCLTWWPHDHTVYVYLKQNWHYVKCHEKQFRHFTYYVHLTWCSPSSLMKGGLLSQ